MASPFAVSGDDRSESASNHRSRYMYRSGLHLAVVIDYLSGRGFILDVTRKSFIKVEFALGYWQRMPQEYYPKDSKRGFWYPTYMIKIILLSAIAVFPFVAIAQEAAPVSPATPLTRVEVNENDNKINFIINGKTKAVLDETGLKVIGRIDSETFRHVPTVDTEPMDVPLQ